MKSDSVQYETIRDDFTVVELENGQVLKIKTSLVEIAKASKKGKEGANLGFSQFTHVITPKDVETYGIEFTKGIATEKDQVRELKFNTTKEVMNVYETKKVIILIGIKVNKVFITNKMNDNGEPILRVNSSNAINTVEKPTYISKPPADESLDSKNLTST